MADAIASLLAQVAEMLGAVLTIAEELSADMHKPAAQREPPDVGITQKRLERFRHEFNRLPERIASALRTQHFADEARPAERASLLGASRQWRCWVSS